MSEFVQKRTKALEDVAVLLLRSRRRAQPSFTELDAWKVMRTTARDSLRDSIDTDMESVLRLDLEIADRRIQALAGFAQDGARETYA